MVLKKVIAVAAAAAVTAAAVIIVPVDVKAETTGTAWVCAADDMWEVQYWGKNHEKNNNIASASDAKIIGDGVYSVSVEFEYAMGYGQFFSLGTDFAAKGKGADAAFADYPEAELSVISVKADGKEIQGNRGVCDMNYYDTMAVYIYNPWEDGKYNYTENLDWSAGIKSLEITFRVTGLDEVEESVIPGEISSVVPVETQMTETSAVTEKLTEQVSETTVVTTETTSEPVTETASASTETVTESVTEAPVQITAVVTENTTTPETSIKTDTVTETHTSATEIAEETTASITENAEQATDSEGDSAAENSEMPSSDSLTDNVNTGNVSAKSLSFLMACAGCAAFVGRKRK